MKSSKRSFQTDGGALINNLSDNKMINKYYQELFKKSLKIGQGTKLQKIIKAPKRILSSVLLSIIARRFNRTFKITTKTFWGDEMTVVIPEVVSLSLFRYGYFEEGLTKMVLEYLKPGATFFDVGAHFGYFTSLSSAIVGRDGGVHSFEPTPSTFTLLKSNVKDRNNVTLNNCAAFSKETTLIFNDYGIRYSAFNSFVNARLDKNTLKKINPQKFEVPAISLDEYILKEKIIPDFIKIDAESAEYEILKGMSQTINDIQPIISIEVGDMDIEGAKSSRDCIQYLIERGYQAYEYKEGRIIRHKLKERYFYDNILFLPEKRSKLGSSSRTLDSKGVN